MDQSDALASAKSAARKNGLVRRARAHEDAMELGQADQAARLLAAFLTPYRGAVIAGYLPIRTEIDPLPALAEYGADSQICMPVITAPAHPLGFKPWSPDAQMVEGLYGTREPAGDVFLRPDVVIVPLVAFDHYGRRLGYGGGYYDRTLQELRATGKVYAIGFAYGGQSWAALPHDEHDQPLDAIVTEDEVLTFVG